MLIVGPSLIVLAIGLLVIMLFQALTGEVKPKKRRFKNEEVIYRRDQHDDNEFHEENKSAA